MAKKNKTVFVAMSGGVDSSVAAALVKKAGFDVVGVFMRPWQPSFAEASEGRDHFCFWKNDREDALRVAAKLNIPLLTWDLSKEYEKRVANYMINGYKKGITPNPDVMCNKFIKFGVFLDKALKMGTDYIATGHYVRVKPRRDPVARHPHSAQSADLRPMVDPHSRHPFFGLYVAKDQNKDQSYFLYTLTQEQLKRCLFPIGDYMKSEVRKLAKKFGLPNWDKKDSQGVCFVGPLKVAEFLKKRIKPKRGQVVRKSDGAVLGEHDGVWFYTVGQRQGMNLAVGKPQYVISKDLKNNVLYVDDSFENPNNKLQIEEFNWISKKINLPLNCKVKTRYRQKDLDCTIIKNGGAVAEVRIAAKNTPVAPGQAAVFYKGDEMLGGGIIS